MFELYLRPQGLQARGAQNIDGTLVPVPRERNTREENKESRLGGYRMAGTKTQIDCKRKTWTHAGSKEWHQLLWI
jgi:hypothetical protein